MENVFVSDVLDYVRLHGKMGSTDKKVREQAINTLKNELIPSIKEKGDVYEKYFYMMHNDYLAGNETINFDMLFANNIADLVKDLRSIDVRTFTISERLSPEEVLLFEQLGVNLSGIRRVKIFDSLFENKKEKPAFLMEIMQ
jgi:hypothetical protein